METAVKDQNIIDFNQTNEKMAYAQNNKIQAELHYVWKHPVKIQAKNNIWSCLLLVILRQ